MNEPKNAYWVLRHGKSIPNEKGIIVSSIENGVLPEFALSLDGIVQAESAGRQFLQQLTSLDIPLTSVRILYSPFSRTTRTANEVANAIGVDFNGPHCRAIGGLRERYFGPSMELQSHEMYSEIWALDEKDPLMAPSGGESVYDVALRLGSVLGAVESETEGCAILLVSHGDSLQILQLMMDTAKIRRDFEAVFVPEKDPSVLSRHRDFALETGELRRVF